MGNCVKRETGVELQETIDVSELNRKIVKKNKIKIS